MSEQNELNIRIFKNGKSHRNLGQDKLLILSTSEVIDKLANAARAAGLVYTKSSTVINYKAGDPISGERLSKLELADNNDLALLLAKIEDADLAAALRTSAQSIGEAETFSALTGGGRAQ